MADDFTFLEQPSEVVAPRLLGCELVRIIEGQVLRGRIVETEAYHEADAASHSYRGQTPRTEVMFGPAGHLYVYFTYGMHYCCNVVTGPVGQGSAVLIRALEPLEGEDIMVHNRHGLDGLQVTNGPAKLCQALQLDKGWNGHDLHDQPLQLRIMPAIRAGDIVKTTRVGISRAKEAELRFYVKNNPFVSKM
jgi:DNA-3-methyladenine glycosylase